MEPASNRAGTEEAVQARVIPTSTGPCIWWARNDLRVEDNPVLRAVVGAAHVDKRKFAAVFCFDPRFLDESPYGRVTDPDFEKSISTRKPVTFSGRKTCALRARFWIQCVLALRTELERRGSRLLVCHGRPEDVLGALPPGSEVKCLPEPVSVEQTDVEEFVRARLAGGGSKLRTDPGAMGLYHPDDLPFHPRERPDSFSALGFALGWTDIWTSAERETWAAPIRGPVPAPKEFPPAPESLELPGMIPADVLADETKLLSRLGYTDEEIEEAQAQEIPEGGEAAARLCLERWAGAASGPEPEDAAAPPAVYWDLPCAGQRGPTAGAVDPMQWAGLTTSFGGMRVSCYMAVGCVTAREILARAQETPFHAMAAHRLMWREFHRMYAIKYHRRIAWLQGPAKVTRTWNSDPEIAEKWKKGLTGVPYIDACQRELLKTGWLAYKGRKTAAHFLVFDLWMDWRIGAFHDEERLLDYDFAMNYGNWAVVSKIGNGGATAWDGSREFDADHWDLRFKLRAEQVNDPAGAYIRKWVPELRAMDDSFIHTPWLMTEDDMKACGVAIGEDYPASLVGPLDIASCDWSMDEHPSQGSDNPSYGELKELLEEKDKELAALRAASAK